MNCTKCGTRMRVQNTRLVGHGKREREYVCPKCRNKTYTTEART